MGECIKWVSFGISCMAFGISVMTSYLVVKWIHHE